jgi:hypothetical protein
MRVIADRIKENSTTAGAGAFVLGGASPGFRPFAAVAAIPDVFYYVIEGVNPDGSLTGEWETGLGTYSAANTLTRTTVLSSSNAGALVNFAAGSKQVWLDQPARAPGQFGALQNEFGPTNFFNDNFYPSSLYGYTVTPTSFAVTGVAEIKVAGPWMQGAYFAAGASHATGTVDNIIGAQGDAMNYGVGHAASLEGVRGDAWNNATGTVGKMAAIVA